MADNSKRFLRKYNSEYPTTETITVVVPEKFDRLCGLVVRVLGYRSGGPGSIPGTTRKKK
jgi:hypothetical protein